jgi:protein-S-isoprenylcysteine O-methyltransferase Ste14
MSDDSTDSAIQSTALGRFAILAYGIISYAIFFATFLYLIGFIGSGIVPKTIDSGTVEPILDAVLINLALLGLFAVQHTIMARPAFKRWWTTIIPVAIERSTFVLVTSLLLILLVWQWRPMPTVIWNIEGAGFWILHGISGIGWGIVLLATFLIDHFDLFGLRQTWSYASRTPYRGPQFHERLLYRVCRHPLMLGFLVAFWFTPTMTVGHLFFAGVTTIYVLVALRIEEATLIEMHGDKYRDYQKRVRMLLPIPR